MRAVIWFCLFSLSIIPSEQMLEGNGFHCMTSHTMKMNRNVHGTTRNDDPPYELKVLDYNGLPVRYYKPLEIYTVRIVGFSHFRGILLQPRLADEQRFLIGHLKGGRFLQEPIWNFYGIRLQNCGTNMNDSITHATDKKKFIVKVMWMADKNVGPVQFMATIMRENSIYWERWQPRSGFILPDNLLSSHSKSDEEIENELLRAEVKKQQSLPWFSFPVDLLSLSTKAPSNGSVDNQTDTTLLQKQIELNKTENENLNELLEGNFDTNFTELMGFAENETNLFEIDNSPSMIIFNHSLTNSSSSFNRKQLPEWQQRSINQNYTEEQLTQENSMNETETELSLNNTEIAFENNTETDILSNTSTSELIEGNIKNSSKTENTPKFQNIFVVANLVEAAGVDLIHKGIVDKPLQPGRFRPVIPKAALSESTTTEPSRLSTKRISSILASGPCTSNPCLNEGRCMKLHEPEGDDGFVCFCKRDYTGKRCEIRDFCTENKCKNGYCKNKLTGYTCECQFEWAGKHCDRSCPSYLCEKGGTCIIADGNNYGCICPPGWTGKKCEIEANECDTSPCRNGATCTDMLNDFNCECATGFMGKTCERPCQDIYKSCSMWFRQGQCEIMRARTEFFDINCAASCKQCKEKHNTIFTDTPLAPILMPFSFLIGVWKATSYNPVHFPFDFSGKLDHYEQTLSFSIPEVTMFDTPSLNYSSVAVSVNDPNDKQITNGFLTIRPDEQKAALLSTGNNGVTTIEEGSVAYGYSINFEPRYVFAHPHNDRQFPLMVKRMFRVNGTYLEETIEKISHDGVKRKNTKYFFLQEYFHYLL